MFAAQEKSFGTYVLYSEEARKFVGFYCRTSGEDVAGMTWDERSVAAALWFLEQHDRWSRAHIRRLSAALSQ